MEERTDIKALDMVRRIRDEQAKQLRGLSDDEIIAYFRKRGKKSRRPVRPLARPANKAHAAAGSRSSPRLMHSVRRR